MMPYILPNLGYDVDALETHYAAPVLEPHHHNITPLTSLA